MEKWEEGYDYDLFNPHGSRQGITAAEPFLAMLLGMEMDRTRSKSNWILSFGLYCTCIKLDMDI